MEGGAEGMSAADGENTMVSTLEAADELMSTARDWIEDTMA